MTHPIPSEFEPRKLPAFRPNVFSAGPLGSLAAWLVALFLVFPTLLVILISFGDETYIEFPPDRLSIRWYIEYFKDERWVEATLTSIRVALGTMVVSTIIGTMASLSFVRGSLPGREFLRILSLGPLITPSIVAAVAVYISFAPLGLTGSYIGFVIAHSMLAVPFVVLVMTASLQNFDTDIELAALSCGASRFRAFFEVVLPNILPGLVSAAILAFLASFDEVTIAIFISTFDQTTLPSKLFEDINNTLTPVIASASTLMVVFSLLLLGMAEGVRSLIGKPGNVASR